MTNEPRVPTQEDLLNLRERAHIVRAINSAIERWDEVAAIAFQAKSAGSMRKDLGALLNLDEMQSTAVQEMQIRRVASKERQRMKMQLEEIELEIAVVTEKLRD